jgi:Ricin-type beta-trefoil lectin domain/Protein of unknown function (DUF1573)/Abnormal spindle-like microcephaly-assoc'd, ASPM-SPD-2-Hydin
MAKFAALRFALAAGLGAAVVTGVSLATAGEAGADQTMIGYDSMRTAWDPAEPKLAPSSVLAPDFGQLFATTLPRPAGQDATSFPNSLYAQPLIADGVLVVATEEDQLDGLDPETGALKWSVSFGPAWTPVSCGDLVPHIGITSTPVFDPATHTLYVSAKTAEGTAGATFKLHAINPQNGAERTGWPQTIAGTATNGGQVFNPATANQRAGLLLMGGSVYLGFASHCDRGPYVGYVAGVNTTLASHPVTLWSTESNLANDKGGIWQSGGGLVSDGPGRIFLATGNGVSPAPGPGTSPPGTLAESVVRLAVGTNGVMTAKDYFSPANNANLDQNDTDLGSGAPAALPDDYGTASHPHLLIQVGKDGNVFLLDRDNLGGTAQGAGGTNKVVSTVQMKGVWGRAALFSSGSGHYIYFVQNSGPMQALRVAPNGAGVPTLSIVGSSALSFPYTSGSPIVTSSGTDPSTALIWVVRSGGSTGLNSTLLAYRAVPPTSGAWDPIFSVPLGTVSKFISPATNNGRVYVGTRDGRVLAFGRPVQAALNAAPTEFGAQPVGTASAVRNVTVSVQTTVTVNSVSATGPFTVGAPSTALPAQFAAGTTFTVPVTFTPTAAGSASGLLHFVAGPANDAYDFSLHGTGTMDGLSADPAAVSFGQVSTSASAQLGVTIQNTGTTDATIQSINLPAAPFTVTGLPAVGAKLGPQGSVTATVLFAPSAQTSYAGDLVVTADTGAVTVHLSGSGVAGTPHITLDPPSLDFGAVQPGASVSKTFVLTNTGNATLVISKAAPPSAPFGVAVPINEGQSVAPGDTLTVTVKFAPTTAKAVSDKYLITGNDGQGAQGVTVKGNQHPWVGRISSPLGCVAIKGNVLANGTAAVSYPCSTSTAQQFSLGATQSIHLGAATSTWCLDVTHSGTAAGTPVQLWTCNGTAAQVWTWRSDNTLYNPHAAKCLYVRGASTTANTPLQIYTCSKANSQYWNRSALVATRGAMSSGVAALNQVCLQDHNGSTASGSVIEIYPCNLTSRQIVTHVGGKLRLFGQCVAAAGTTIGAKIGLYRCTTSSSQSWTYRTDGSLLNVASGKCLDDPRALTTPLTALRLYTCNGSKAQRWTVP